MNTFKIKLIHVAYCMIQNHGRINLLLRQLDPFRFVWFREEKSTVEIETPIWGATYEEALMNAYQTWKENLIQPYRCGYRYTLPERDEVGTTALFHQMVASYSSTSGVYFDEELGSNCIVHFASQEAKALWKHLEKTGQL